MLFSSEEGSAQVMSSFSVCDGNSRRPKISFPSQAALMIFHLQETLSLFVNSESGYQGAISNSHRLTSQRNSESGDDDVV